MRIPSGSTVVLGAVLSAALIVGCEQTKGDEWTADDCADYCNNAMIAYAGSDCPPAACGWDIGGQWEGELGVYVVDVAASGDGGSTCSLVMPSDCEVESDCNEIYTACLLNSGAPEDCLAALEACFEAEAELAEIESGDDAEDDARDACHDARRLCVANADYVRDTCYSTEPEAYWVDRCDLPWAEAVGVCECQLEACVEGEDPLDCLGAPAVPMMTGPGRGILTRDAIDAAMREMEELRADAGAVRVLDAEGRVRGVWLMSIEQGDLLARMGLRTDDVVLTVNGRTIPQLLLRPDALREVYAAREWRVVIERGASTRQLVYRIVDRIGD